MSKLSTAKVLVRRLEVRQHSYRSHPSFGRARVLAGAAATAASGFLLGVEMRPQ